MANKEGIIGKTKYMFEKYRSFRDCKVLFLSFL